MSDFYFHKFLVLKGVDFVENGQRNAENLRYASM